MLVITRTVDQRIMVGHDIVITLVKARSGQAEIGIEAPKEVLILREELLNNGETNASDHD